MRQSLSDYSVELNGARRRSGPLSDPDVGKGRTAPRASVSAMGVGLLLTVFTLIALVVDQMAVHGLADHVNGHYAPLGLHPDPNVLFGFLYVTELTGLLLWLSMIWAVRGQKRWARLVASMILVVATSIAFLVLFVSEFGTPIFPTSWGILGLLPCLAGLAAVTLMSTP